MILADDHAMVAEGLGRLISEVADLVGQVTDGRQLVDSARRLKPDIIISDISMQSRATNIPPAGGSATDCARKTHERDRGRLADFCKDCRRS